MDRKKYRWNPRKCARNMGGLMIRTCLTAALLILMGAVPSVADEPQMVKIAPNPPHRAVFDKDIDRAKKTPEIDAQAPQTEPEPPSYTQEELDMLAHVIAGEAIGCDDTEQLYVGSVVLNRIAHHLYPNTMAEVIEQPSQYGCYHAGAWSPAAQNPSDRCYENARYLLENGSVLPENVVFQAQFTQGDGVYERTAWHVYCYTNR